MYDYVNVEQPLDMIDKSILETSYKDRNALIEVVVEDEEGLIATIAQLKTLVGEDGVVSGDAATLSFAQSSTNEEISKIMAFLIPIIIFILMISTSSWFEPFLFLFTVGISILINRGTNVFLGEVSFITVAILIKD